MSNKQHSRLFVGALLVSLAAPAFAPPSAKPQRAEFEIQGTFCGGCVTALTKVVNRIEGVSKTEVVAKERLVMVSFDAEVVTPDQILEVVNEETPFDLALTNITDLG